MPNQIKKGEKTFAGFLLIIFTLLPALFIISYWPDRLPTPKEFVKPLYYNDPFHVRLAGICDSLDYATSSQSIVVVINSNPENNTSITTKEDSASKKAVSQAVDAATEKIKSEEIKKKDCKCNEAEDETVFIHINTLLLILVAVAGFLGNMIHVATSFTTFVASKAFVRSWMLWYFVRPFSASALALAFYFVFRGGYLNMNDDSTNINLYGVITISILVGLFTDRATQKLKDVFEALFKPTENRPDTLTGDIVIQSITPPELKPGEKNIITISGDNLKSNLSVTINEEAVALTSVSKTSATVEYTIPESQTGKTEFILIIKSSEDGSVLKSATLILAKAKNADENQETADPGLG